MAEDFDLKINSITGDVECVYGTERIERLLRERFKRDLLNVYTSMNISTASGDDLDKLAELFGIKRHDATSPTGHRVIETDDELRHKIRSFALGGDGHMMDPDDLPVGLVPFEFQMDDDKTPVTIGPKCECGAAALGYTQPGPGHAHWCPISTK